MEWERRDWNGSAELGTDPDQNPLVYHSVPQIQEMYRQTALQFWCYKINCPEKLLINHSECGPLTCFVDACTSYKATYLFLISTTLWYLTAEHISIANRPPPSADYETFGEFFGVIWRSISLPYFSDGTRSSDTINKARWSFHGKSSFRNIVLVCESHFPVFDE